MEQKTVNNVLPFHTKWAKEKLNKTPDEFKDEVLQLLVKYVFSMGILAGVVISAIVVIGIAILKV